MKKVLSCLAAALILFSCARKEVPSEDGCAVLNVSVCRASATKALFSDNRVNSLQVFVFDGDRLDAYGSINGSLTLSLTSTTGPKTLVALVNAPAMDSVTSLNGLMSAVSKLDDNSPDNFVMVGSSALTLSNDNDVSITVGRLAARIVLHKMTRKLSAPGYADAVFELVRIYAADVVTGVLYSGAPAPGTHRKNTDSIDVSDEFLLRLPSSPAMLAQGESYAEDLCLYVYPDAGTTKMVVECLIDGRCYTYPIAVSNVQPNRSYEVNELIVTRLGNPSNGDDVIDPGEVDVIETGEIGFSVDVNPWNVVLVGDAGRLTI